MNGTAPMEWNAPHPQREREYMHVVQYFGTHSLDQIYPVCGGLVRIGSRDPVAGAQRGSWYGGPPRRIVDDPLRRQAAVTTIGST